ncbi:hypothetical protein [Phaeobacter inhibens]|uniref:hypothetical protein n=1 Tax=Phaeobacter inhibens TaxID=221822 RepID=UPI0021A5D658|nr:hypothetical protein [Phaeobacter inhibens]UWR74105.1 hypothetical protein K4L00_08380 [Phaeobacter inhibens]
MAKRIHVLHAKTGQLRAGWGRPERGAEPDLCYAWGGGGASKSDSRLICNALEQAGTSSGKTLREELEARGYDIATLKFSIEQKQT